MMQNRQILGALLLAAGLVTSGFSAVVIDAVRIENAEDTALDESFVRAYTSLRAGQEIGSEAELNAAVAHDVDTLRRSGRFSFVRASVEQEGDQFTLVYSVASRVRLRHIEITGAKHISSRKIKQQLELTLGDYVDEALIGEKARKTEAWCRKNKYPDAVLTWDLKTDKTTGAGDLTVTVNEGPKVRVKQIAFEGERFLSDSRTARTGRFLKRLLPDPFPSKKAASVFEPRELRGILQQKKTWWITPWFGAYRPELTEADLSVIRTFYLNRGFLDVQVSDPEAEELGRGRLKLTYRIQEGVPYRIGEVRLSGVTLFEPEQIRSQIPLQSGATVSRAAIDAAAAAAGRYYGNRGYINTYVRPVIDADPATQMADIRFEVHEGVPAEIGEIHIRGNEKTRDEVMRRELAVHPGEPFHQQKVETSENRLKNLGYFERVDSGYTPAAQTNAYDLTFNVKEKSMGSFLIGAGFSSVDNLVGFAELSHGNFDIKRWPPVGDGQKMKIRVQAGTERKDAEISFVEPWFLDRKLALGADLYHRDADYYSDEYKLRTLGGRLSLSRPLSPFVRGTLSYSLEQFDVYDVTTNASARIQAEEGIRTKSTAGASLSRDTRDQFFIPTRGNYSSASAEFSGGPLGADTDIYFLEVKSSQFWPLWNGHVLNLKGAIRTVERYGDSAEVPIFDRLFLGGPNSIRGFKYRHVGPRDDQDEPIGGRSSWYATLEYTVPLWSKIRAATFYDIGAVSEDSFDFSTPDVSSSVGVGARFDLPMFPLRLDYAWPLDTDQYNADEGGRWNFLLGYSF
jgi:outer membrane protein insertion porin family